MKLILLFLFFTTVSYSQKEVKDFSSSHSLKQDLEQYQFDVLESGKKGVIIHKKDRFYYWYKAQKVMSTQGGSSGQLLDGDFESFHENKQLSKKGFFRKGLKHGEWLYWRTDGTLIKTENWKRGIKQGKQQFYNSYGIVNQTIEIKRAKTISESNDSIIISKRNGVVQTHFIKDSLGKIEKSAEYKNGKLHGVSKEYSEGKLISKSHYKKGVLIPQKQKKGSSGEDSEGKEAKRSWKLFNKRESNEDTPEKNKGLFKKSKETDENSTKVEKTATPKKEKKKNIEKKAKNTEK